MKALFIIGPSGAGKSTLTKTLNELYTNLFGKCCTLTVNLDCANSNGNYDVDINQLVQLQDIMEEYQIGPNGSLLYSIDFLWENLEWLNGKIQKSLKSKNPSFNVLQNKQAVQKLKLSQMEIQNIFILFDLPGQMQLYLNHDSMKKVIKATVQKYKLVGVVLQLFDATYIYQVSDFVSMCMITITSMINLQLPHLSLLNKIDLLKGRRPADGMLDDYLINSNIQRMVQDLSEGQHHPILASIARVIDLQARGQFLPCSAYKPQLLLNVVFQLQKIFGTLQSNLISCKRFTTAVSPLLNEMAKQQLLSNLDSQLFHQQEETDFQAELLKIKAKRLNQI